MPISFVPCCSSPSSLIFVLLLLFSVSCWCYSLCSLELSWVWVFVGFLFVVIFCLCFALDLFVLFFSQGDSFQVLWVFVAVILFHFYISFVLPLCTPLSSCFLVVSSFIKKFWVLKKKVFEHHLQYRLKQNWAVRHDTHLSDSWHTKNVFLRWQDWMFVQCSDV